jgi:FkbM family methyltransferase
MFKVLLKSAWDVFKDEGFGGLVRETLKYLSIYNTPKKLLGCAWQKQKQPVVVKSIQGSLMELDLNAGGIHTDLFMNGFREPEATRTMQEIIKPDMTVLDIGANIGYYALMEAKRCKDVYAIEPDPANYKHLTRNVELNGYKNVHLHNIAVGDKSGRLDFALSSVPNWHRVAVGGEKNVISVPAITVDDFMQAAGNPQIDLLRMDVEGYECNILYGARKTISKWLPDMFIEVHRDLLKNFGYTARKLFQLLGSYDYSVYKSFVLARPSYAGRIRVLLQNEHEIYQLTEKGMATHIFFRYNGNA